MLVLFLCFYLYAGFHGTPWGKKHHETKIKTYLEEKYQMDFVIMKTSYNFLSETYQAYAHPKEHEELLFLAEQDPDSNVGYSDTYPKVFWDSGVSNRMKAKIKGLFPNVDLPTLKALRIIDRGEYFGPQIPTYRETNASPLACSITINIKKNWEQMNQEREKEKMLELSNYLQELHFPVLIEVRYFENELHEDDKVFFITEERRIVD